MIKILYVCTHNSARSQIAEAYTRLFSKQQNKNMLVESAGLHPGKLNKFVVQALQEEGIDISGKKPQSVIELFKDNRDYNYVITVCSRETEELCPVFPGLTERLNWSFEDPSDYRGTNEEILLKVKILQEEIKEKVFKLISGLE